MPENIPSEHPEHLARFLTTLAGRILLSEVGQLPADSLARHNTIGNWDLKRFATLLEPDELPEFGHILQGRPNKELIALAVRVAAGRDKAKTRFPSPLARSFFLTDEMLAQATSSVVSAYHAAGLSPLGSVTDLCCGGGMDSIAFASAGMNVVAVDMDASRLIFARANAALFDVTEHMTFRCEDAVAFPITTDALFADPARRVESGVRVSRYSEQYLPPLSQLQEKAKQARGACLKLSPLLPDEVLFSLGGRIEFLSENRECKEACVWFGEAYGSGGDAPLAAIILPDRIAIIPDDSLPIVRAVGAFVYEPDPAIIRAGAVPATAARLGFGYISPEDVYLTGDDLPTIPSLVRTYRVIEAMPFHRKEVAAFVRKAKYGRVVVKKRRARMEPEALLTEIKASNRGPEPEVILILVREPKGHSVVFCTPVLLGD